MLIIDLNLTNDPYTTF